MKIIDGREYFRRVKNYTNIFLYGAGSKGIQTNKILQKKGIIPQGFIDSNPEIIGRVIDGIEVVSYERVKQIEKYCIIITTVMGTAVEIFNSQKDRGERNEVFFCANPFKSEICFLEPEEVTDEILEKNLNCLQDDISKNIFCDFLNWKITGNATFIWKYTEGNWLEFFSSDLIPVKEDYTFVDVGAYTGDTVIRFMAFCKGKYNKILAFEPDLINYGKLNEFIELSRLPAKRIDVRQIGLWSDRKTLEFYSASDRNIYESSNFFCPTLNLISRNRNCGGEGGIKYEVEVNRLDDFIDEIEGNVILKIDALSSEYEILKGAEYVIKKYHPVIIMEIGTRCGDIFKVLPLIKKYDNKYEIYLRQLIVFDNSRTIIIAR